MFKCPVCGKEFATPSALKAHHGLAHKGLPPPEAPPKNSSSPYIANYYCPRCRVWVPRKSPEVVPVNGNLKHAVCGCPLRKRPRKKSAKNMDLPAIDPEKYGVVAEPHERGQICPRGETLNMFQPETLKAFRSGGGKA